MHENTDLDMLRPGYNGKGTAGLLVVQWTHRMPVPAASTPVLCTALTTCSFSFAPERVQNSRGNTKHYFPSDNTTEILKLSLKCPVCVLTLNVFCNS